MPTGTESRFQDMTLLAEALEVDGIAIGGIAASAAIANISETTATMDAAERIKFNAILAALRAHGIIAT